MKLYLTLFLFAFSLLSSAQAPKKPSKTDKYYACIIQEGDTIEELSNFNTIQFSWKKNTNEIVDSVRVRIVNWAWPLLVKDYPIPENQNWLNIDLKEYGEAEVSTRLPKKEKYCRMLFEVFKKDTDGKMLHPELWSFPFTVRYLDR